MKKKIAVLVVALLAMAVPTVASASIEGELHAGNLVEQAMQKRYRSYTVAAVCDQQGRKKFWCSVDANRGHCFVFGHAWVRSGHVTLVGVNRSCF